MYDLNGRRPPPKTPKPSTAGRFADEKNGLKIGVLAKLM